MKQSKLLRIQVLKWKSDQEKKKRRIVKVGSGSETERGEVKKTQAEVSSRTHFVNTEQQVQGNTSGVVLPVYTLLIKPVCPRMRIVRQVGDTIAVGQQLETSCWS